MEKEINKLLLKIIIEVIFVMILIIFIGGINKNVVNARETIIPSKNNLVIDVINKGDYVYLLPVGDNEVYCDYNSAIFSISNLSGNLINYNLILRMNKIANLNNYKVMLLGNIYRLDELEYYEDYNYLYFDLGNYLIGNKNQNFTFILWLSDENLNYDNTSIKYSFLVDEVDNAV